MEDACNDNIDEDARECPDIGSHPDQYIIKLDSQYTLDIHSIVLG